MRDRRVDLDCSRQGRSRIIENWRLRPCRSRRGEGEPRVGDLGYVDKTVYTCQKGRNRRTTTGEFRPYTGDQGAVIVSFQDDDAGYRAWLRAWPNGFVLNCNRNPTPDYLALHRGAG